MSALLATVLTLAAEVAADFRAFCALLVIRTKAGGMLAFAYGVWHAEQKLFQRTRTGRDLVLKARQIGFSTLELARDVHFAVTREGVNVLIVSHDSDLCEQMFRDVTRMVDALVTLRLVPKPIASSVREVVFGHNGSAIRIVEAGATERVADKRGRSGTIHRLHATELAFWGAAEATMAALLAACADDAEIVIESTANGASGLFYKLVTKALAGEGDYRLHFYAWHAHVEYRATVPVGFDPTPRDEHEKRLRAKGCDDAQIAWWRARVDDPARGGIDRVLQEYPYDPQLAFRAPGGRWLDPSLADWLVEVAAKVIRRERVTVTMMRDGKAIGARDLGELLVFAEPTDDVVLGCDVAGGGGGDNDASVARARSKRSGRLLASFKSNTIEPGDFGIAAAWIARRMRGALVGFERNNHGHAAIRACTTERTDVTPYQKLYSAADDKLGWHTTLQTRPIMWDEWHSRLRAARLERDGVGLIDSDGAAEARTLVLKDGRPEAQSSAHDDVFTADAIAWQLRSRASGGRVGDDGRAGAGESSWFDGAI